MKILQEQFLTEAADPATIEQLKDAIENLYFYYEQFTSELSMITILLQELGDEDFAGSNESHLSDLRHVYSDTVIDLEDALKRLTAEPEPEEEEEIGDEDR